ncbi:hypothetical protein AAIR98_001684 [Elusimicrobium simillimum]|uniref:hypothetical protein n=1 Tax=Elusimicrobium simillimum TaxID=3143438 RepID=UPI003C6F196C
MKKFNKLVSLTLSLLLLSNTFTYAQLPREDFNKMHLKTLDSFTLLKSQPDVKNADDSLVYAIIAYTVLTYVVMFAYMHMDNKALIRYFDNSDAGATKNNHLAKSSKKSIKRTTGKLAQGIKAHANYASNDIIKQVIDNNASRLALSGEGVVNSLESAMRKSSSIDRFVYLQEAELRFNRSYLEAAGGYHEELSNSLKKVENGILSPKEYRYHKNQVYARLYDPKKMEFYTELKAGVLHARKLGMEHRSLYNAQTRLYEGKWSYDLFIIEKELVKAHLPPVYHSEVNGLFREMYAAAKTNSTQKLYVPKGAAYKGLRGMAKGLGLAVVMFAVATSLDAADDNGMLEKFVAKPELLLKVKDPQTLTSIYENETTRDLAISMYMAIEDIVNMSEEERAELFDHQLKTDKKQVIAQNQADRQAEKITAQKTVAKYSRMGR